MTTIAGVIGLIRHNAAHNGVRGTMGVSYRTSTLRAKCLTTIAHPVEDIGKSRNEFRFGGWQWVMTRQTSIECAFDEIPQ